MATASNFFNVYYVYEYFDPATSNVFYVGKGKGNRKLAHVEQAQDSSSKGAKVEKIRELLALGYQPNQFIREVKSNLSELEAFSYESMLIEKYGLDSLTNLVYGIGKNKRTSVKFTLGDESTKRHYNNFIASLDLTYDDGIQPFVMEYQAAETIIETSEILLAKNPVKLCVIECVEIVYLLSLLGYDMNNVTFVSDSVLKCTDVNYHLGCAVGFYFLGTKMKFDCVIGNPPYSCYSQFIDKALNVANDVVMITPAAYLYNAFSSLHKRNFKDRLDYAYVDDNHGHTYFSAGVQGSLAIAKFSKERSDTFCLINAQSEEVYEYKNDEFVSIILNNKSAKSIFDKTRTADRLTDEDNVAYVRFQSKHQLHYGSGINKVLLGSDFYKGMINPKTCISDTKKDKCTCTASFNSSEEAQNAIDFYSFAPIRIASVYISQTGGGGGTTMLKNAPVVDFTKKWTKEMVMERFGITEYEWEYAERCVKGISIDEF